MIVNFDNQHLDLEFDHSERSQIDKIDMFVQQDDPKIGKPYGIFSHQLLLRGLICLTHLFLIGKFIMVYI